MGEREIFDFIFKFILIGNGSSGKTSLLYYFMQQKEKKAPQQTIGVEFSSKLVTIQSKNVKLQLWDTAGQERYRSITKTYYRGALGALIVFDLTNNESFEAIDQWVRDAKEFSRPDIQIMVIANKSDLEEDRVITKSQAQQFCQDRGLQYIETSAVTGYNVNEAFLELTKSTLAEVDSGKIASDSIKPRFFTSGQRLSSQDENRGRCSC